MKSFDEIKKSLTEIFSDGMNCRLYFGVDIESDRRYYLADLDDPTTKEICEYYVKNLKDYLEEEISTLRLSELDARSDVLVFYDLEQQPSEFKKIDEISKGKIVEKFNFSKLDFSNIKSLTVEIASTKNKVVFYKKFYPISLVKRDQVLLYKKESRLTMIGEDVIKITPGFELMLLDNEFFINDFSKFEKNFGFDDIANKIRNEVVTSIHSKDLVIDKKNYLSTLSIPRKDVIRAKQSRVLNLNVEIIVSFALERQGKIGLKVENGKLILNSKESIKKLFRLLNDDYLKSELTQLDYEILAKNELVTA